VQQLLGQSGLHMQQVLHQSRLGITAIAGTKSITWPAIAQKKWISKCCIKVDYVLLQLLEQSGLGMQEVLY
jgi:hypothetical protein